VSSLEGLREGDPIMVPSVFAEGMVRRTVAKVAKVWLTDDKGHRYRIETGRSEYHGSMGRYAVTVAEYEDREELRQLHDVLRSWGMYDPTRHPRHVPTRAQLRLVADLLRSFERAEDHG
jgi:hypothetical protein